MHPLSTDEVMPTSEGERRRSAGARNSDLDEALSQDHLYSGSDPTLITLSHVLNDSKKRKALQELNGERAQLLIDFLYSLLLQPEPTTSRSLPSVVVALYRLVNGTKLYPQCYIIDDVTVVSQETGGAFCDIYRGRHGERHLCLKVVRLFYKADTDAALKVFAKEAILWGQLDHPNIVPFYGIYYLDEDRERICLVSPWMENGNIVQYLDKNPHLPRVPFIRDVVLGLEYLHKNDVIHGDLKGLNVLVNNSGRACIADFGMSGIRHDKTLAITVTNIASGFTYRWTAPELLDGESPATTASDIWAFAGVCYEILARRPPFYEYHADSQVMLRLMAGALPTRPPRDVTSELDIIDDTMWDLMNCCWVREPARRPNCQCILEMLDFPISPEKETHGVREGIQFQSIMKKKSILIDTLKVKEILQDL